MSRTRFSKGVATAYTGEQALSQFPYPDPAKCSILFNDFHTYAAGDWTTTDADSGSVALAAGDGGVLLLTTGATSADSSVITPVTAGFNPVAGYEMWFETRVALSDATNSALFAGLINLITTPFTGGNITDGFYFTKASGSTALGFNAIGSSVALTGLTSIATMANATFITLGVWVDTLGNINVYVNDNKVGTIAAAGGFPAVALAVTLGVKTGGSAAKTLSVDYILASKFRQ